MKTLVTIALLSVFSLVAQDVPARGYDKTAWGMNQAEVRAIYPEFTWKNIKANGNAGSEPWQVIRTERVIQGARFELTLGFKGDKLNTVFLTSSEQGDGIKASLIAKYGAPVELKPTTFQWRPEGSTITFSTTPKPHYMVTIAYVAGHSVEAAGL
jgi:hypothetical protein